MDQRMLCSQKCPRLLGARRFTGHHYARFKYIESTFPSLSISRSRLRFAIGQYLHWARLRVAKFTRSQEVIEATADPHHYYRYQIRHQCPGQRHLLPTSTTVVRNGGLIVARARAARTRTLLWLNIHSGWRLNFVNDRRRWLFWWFRLRFHMRRLVTGTFFETIFVIGKRTVARTAARTVPRFLCQIIEIIIDNID